MTDQNKTLYTLIIFSENVSGVLTKVTHVFTRRQLNIESLNVSASSIEGIHRYTITCRTDEDVIKIITQQVEKIVDVLQASYFTQDEIFIMETALFKLSTTHMTANREISKAIRLHNAKILEVNAVYAIVSLEGMSDDVVSLHDTLKPLGCIIQFVRSGAIAITRAKQEHLMEFLEERALAELATNKQ